MKAACARRAKRAAHATAHSVPGRPQAVSSAITWFALPPSADVVINGTSIGLYDAAARVPVALDSLRPGLVAADVVFSPPDTRFLEEARSRGCTTIDGLGMLVNQGVIGVRHWTGVDPDVPAMRVALAEALGVSIA